MFFFFFFFFFLKKMRSFWKLTRVYGAILEFYTKNLRAVHMSYFPSKNTEMTNGVLTLKILKTLLKYIATF